MVDLFRNTIFAFWLPIGAAGSALQHQAHVLYLHCSLLRSMYTGETSRGAVHTGENDSYALREQNWNKKKKKNSFTLHVRSTCMRRY